MAKSGMNPKTLQYLMGHSDIAVTLNVYTHIGLDDATEELRKLEEMENARRELEKGQAKPASKPENVQSNLMETIKGRAEHNARSVPDT